MYSEQLAVLLFIAAAHAAGPGINAQPTLQMPREVAQNASLQVKTDRSRKSIRREREAMMLAEFR